MEFTGALRQSGSQSPGERIRVKMTPKMDEPNEKPRRYRWPWFVLAAFLLGVALAILWMIFEIRIVEQERNPNAPLPAGSAQ
jgi:hypothetical protein